MQIGFIFSSKDPKQKKARDYIKGFIEQHGILAKFDENDRPVSSPTLYINGMAISDKRKQPRDKDASMFPDIPQIKEILEYHTWCL